MASPIPPAKSQFFDQNGEPLVAGKVYHYQPGSTVPVTTYQDIALSIPNTSPIILDGSGYALIYSAGGVFRQVVYDALDNLIWDAVTSCPSPAAELHAINGDLAVSGALTGASLTTTANVTVGGVLSAKTLSTTSDAAVQGSMSVTGPFTGFNSGAFQSLFLSGPANITGNITSLGFCNLASLGVPGNSIFNGTTVCAPVGETAQSIYGGIGTTGFHDQVEGVTVMPGNVSSATGQYTAVAGYIRNQAAQNFAAGQPNGVALFGAGTSEADFANTWGINTLLQDNAIRGGPSTGIGRQLLNEFDFTVTCPDTVISGLNLTGSCLVKPKSSTALGVLPIGDIANGVHIGWDQALWSTDGAATYITVAGLLSSSLTVNGRSQSHNFVYGDRTGIRQFAQLWMQGNPNAGGGIMVMDGAGLPVALQLTNGFIQVGGAGTYFSGPNQVLGPRINGWGAPRGGTRVQLDPNTATLPQLVNAFNALIFDLLTHGAIGS